MKISLCIFIILIFNFKVNCQTESSTYNDMCSGCCGLEYEFFKSGTFNSVHDGYSRYKDFGSWSLINDTLKVEFLMDSGSVLVYEKRDSLSYKQISPSGYYKLIFKKEQKFDNGSFKKYYYDFSMNLEQVVLHDSNGIIRKTLEYKKRSTKEVSYNEKGFIQSIKIWRKERLVSEKVYDKNGTQYESRKKFLWFQNW